MKNRGHQVLVLLYGQALHLHFFQSLSIRIVLVFAPSVGTKLPSAVFPCHINDGLILGEFCITRDVWQVYRAPGAR